MHSFMSSACNRIFQVSCSREMISDLNRICSFKNRKIKATLAHHLMTRVGICVFFYFCSFFNRKINRQIAIGTVKVMNDFDFDFEMTKIECTEYKLIFDENEFAYAN